MKAINPVPPKTIEITNIHRNVAQELIEITVDISDLKHLQRVIQSLKSIRGIEDIERINEMT